MTTKHQWFSLVRRSLFALGCAGAATTALLVGETDANAQGRFGDKGQLAITAENLFEFGTERYGESVVNGERSATVNHLGFLFSRCGASPRCQQVGASYFIMPSLSLGATIGYESRSGTNTSTNNNGIVVTTTPPNDSTFVFVPKVGYALMLGQVVGFWFRGGLGYFYDGGSAANQDSNSYWFLSGDADLVVSPFQHWAFYAGPQFDLSFTGSHTEPAPMGARVSWDASYRDFGVGVGIIGYVDL